MCLIHQEGRTVISGKGKEGVGTITYFFRENHASHKVVLAKNFGVAGQ